MAPVDRLNPFLAAIVDRRRLNKSPGERETWHFVLNIEGSGLEYHPGDSFAVYPENDPVEVSRIIQALRLDPKVHVKDAKGGEFSLQEFLLKKANISHVPKKFLVALHKAGSDTFIEALLTNDEQLKQFTSTHNLLDIVEAHPASQWDPSHFVQSLQPMLPRFYSIASSQSAKPHEVEFTIARVQYNIEGRERRGVCSHYLCDVAPLHQPSVAVYLQPTKDFRLPHDDTKDIVMVGPGTGVAPFRAFMQERVVRNAPGRNWLFFGERYRNEDFFYEEYWNELSYSNLLRLETAFSRDQDEKCYVQHRMWENRHDLWRWLETGAHLYVCGSADKMAKDVDKCLHEIVEKEGNLSPEAAREFVKRLRHEKRYLRDVY